MLLAKDIRDRERGGRAEIRVIEGDAESNSPQNMEVLEGVLGKRSSKPTDGPPDETADQEQKSKLTLYQWAAPPLWHPVFHSCFSFSSRELCPSSFYLFSTLFRVSDDDGKMKVTEVASRPLVQDLLSHEVSLSSNKGCKCYIIRPRPDGCH